ncbi:MAG: hypothetical protein K5771_09355 [Oscillospiraceae bacterium]|nr:hypothetical protein [Oscillospiraceae bacterium]
MRKLCLKFIILLCLSALLTGLCACGSKLSRAEREALAAEYAKTSLSMTVSDPEELSVLDNYTALEDLDLSGSTCYREIEEYIATHPSVNVKYTVALDPDGTVLENRAHSAVLDKGAYVAVLAENSGCFHELREIIISSPDFSEDDLSKLAAAFPAAEILFRINPDVPDIAYNASEADLSALVPEDVENAAAFLEKMPDLETAYMTADDGTDLLSFADLRKLQDSSPDTVFDYRFESFGQMISTADEDIVYDALSNCVYIYNDGMEQIREMMPCMTRLKTMFFQYCEVDYEVLAQFRADFPDVDIVWRINFGPYSCRTDTERIFANGSLDAASCYNLRYCNRVKYIDLGHNDYLTSIDFAAFMPDLEIGIFAATSLYDISPLANCTKLRYLEIFVTNVSDLSALANCTELEQLNVSCCFSLRDLSPLAGLTKLKRVWNTYSSVPQAKRNEIVNLLPDCEFCFTKGGSTDYGWRYDNYGNMTDYYAELYEIFGYENFRDNISWW